MDHGRKRWNTSSCFLFQEGLEGTYEAVVLLGSPETKQEENDCFRWPVRAPEEEEKIVFFQGKDPPLETTF